MPTIKPKTGYAREFFLKVSVSSASFAATNSPDVLINVNGITNFSLSNETPGAVVEVSYNGTYLGDELDASQTTKYQVYNNRVVDAIWFRLKSGPSATICVRAW